jgi:hypothetical protein
VCVCVCVCVHEVLFQMGQNYSRNVQYYSLLRKVNNGHNWHILWAFHVQKWSDISYEFWVFSKSTHNINKWKSGANQGTCCGSQTSRGIWDDNLTQILARIVTPNMERAATKFMHLLIDKKQNQVKTKIISSVLWPPEKIQSPATPHVVSLFQNSSW